MNATIQTLGQLSMLQECLSKRERIRLESHIRGIRRAPKRLLAKVEDLLRAMPVMEVKKRGKVLEKQIGATPKVARKLAKQAARKAAYNAGWRKHRNGKSITSKKSGYQSLAYFASITGSNNTSESITGSNNTSEYRMGTPAIYL